MTTKTEAASEVRKILQSVKDRLAQPGGSKVNEATTRAHFITPLLAALGYVSIDDIVFEHYLPNATTFLDYRLVVNGKPRVSVEAKALDVSLSEKDAAQAVQYAAVLGDEWAVVTNAREWKLYHTFAKTDLPGKHILTLNLVSWESDEQFNSVFERLWLVSKDLFETANGPESWLTTRKLDHLMRSALTDPASPEVKYLRKRLQDQEVGVTTEQVAGWLKSRLEPRAETPGPVAATPQLPVVIALPATTFTPTAAPLTPAAPAPAASTAVPLAAIGALPPPGVSSAAKVRVNDGPLYLVTPVADEPEATVAETLHSLLDHEVYVFGDRTAGRAVLREGDHICFYHSGVGVVADAEIAGSATKKAVTFAKHAESYPWAFPVRSVRFYLDAPVVIDAHLRAQLDAFKGKDPGKGWSWFVQGTRYATAHDFALLTGSGA